MLQSYEAIYDHGQLRWLTDKPPAEEARVIVTLIPSQASAATQTGEYGVRPYLRTLFSTVFDRQ